MKKFVLIGLQFLLSLCCMTPIMAQVPGDTIVVNSLNYSSITRDTMVNFPNLPGVTYEKILMLYNMRCKNGLVSPGIAGQTNIGCGEWDYSCNTNITDSSMVDSVKATAPSHIIGGFSGTVFPYTTNPTFTYYQYQQQAVTYTSTTSETSGTIGIGASSSQEVLSTNLQHGKSQYLYTAAELSAAGITAGDITSLKLFINTLGSDANFLKIKMKSTTKVALDNSNPDLNGFTEVYFLNTQPTLGANQYKFHTPFNWNGTDNVIIEFSFSNSSNGSATSVEADNTSNASGLFVPENDLAFDFDGSNRIDLNSSGLGSISNEITFSFWAKGNAATLPSNTSVLYCTNASGHRQANIHLPWSDQTVYWDCGSGGSYDRINKLALPAEYEGNWTHWTFTKNATSGVMNIYINGVLWHSGTGKTIPLAFTKFNLGMSSNNSNPYFGTIDDFNIFAKELSPSTISSMLYRKVDNAHPDYANLVATYRLNDANTAMCYDSSANVSTGNIVGNANWIFHRGEQLFKNFQTTTLRPKMEIVQGVYVSAINTITVIDSIKNNPSQVKTYAVNAANDLINTATNQYYSAGYTYVYDAASNAIIDSVLNPTQNTINITTLNYYRKSPSHFQIMSFVTPYGINLNLGMAGKTWTFDVTDFAPIMKGPKRLFMNAGGEYQEQMDIKFLFIVGTPPREVKTINNIWKVDPPGYTNIINDNFFEPRTFTLPTASAYKVKTAITGHGQEGEFIPRTHTFNVNGGTPEFSWDVWKACASNPVYPQGGTWIYDRAGWCPGMATDIKEMDITPYVSSGATTTLDYHLTTASGASNYWVSNQLVSYGPPNFVNDAAVIDIINPTTKVEYARTNAMCENPKIVIQNTGSAALTSARIDYWINAGTKKKTFNWTGNLAFLEKAEITLQGDDIWHDLTGATGNYFYAEIIAPNGGTDAYSFNNKIKTPFNITGVLPADIYMEFRTNLFAAESAYRLKDGDGNVLFTRSNMTNSTLYRDTFKLPFGCYSFEITDTDDDGINFWANSDGTGNARIRRIGNNAILYTFQGDFGKSIEYNFTVDYPLSYQELENEAAGPDLFPNPATSSFTLDLKDLPSYQIEITTIMGQRIEIPFDGNGNQRTYRTSALPKGIYFLNAYNSKHHWTKKITIE